MRTHSRFTRVLSVMLALVLVLGMIPVFASAADTTTIYVQPNSNWLMDGARFAAYFFGNGETWVDCVDAGEGLYSVEVPAGYTNVIFCRMNPGTTANNWSNKWNQTKDLKVPTDNKTIYVVDGWDKGSGQWIEKGGELEEIEVVYYLRGTMNGWGIDNPMTKNEDGTYSVTISLAPGTYTFKAADEGWGSNWGEGGAGGADMSITVEEAADVTFTLDIIAGTVTHDYAPNCIHVWDEGTQTVAPSCTVAGQATFTCTLCGETKDGEVAALGHNYVDGSCTVCGEAKPVLTYYLVGYINGADYGCKDDYENLGEYKFVNGTLTATFSADSYVFVKTGDNVNWFLADAYCQDTTCTMNTAGTEKMYVPGAVELTFTLVENSDNTITLSYTTNSAPCQHPAHGEDGICADCGMAVAHSYVNGVCSVCGLVQEPIAVSDFYVAGTINGWNEKDENYKMTLVDDVYVLELTIGAGVTEFKVTDGTWDNCWPASNYLIDSAEECTIKISYNPVTNEVIVTGFQEAEPDYYLHGYINGADYYEADYLFVNGTLTTTFSADSYVYICTNSGVVYMAESYIEQPSGKFVLGGNEKMFVPAGDVTFTLVENEDGSLTLSYTTGAEAGATVSGTITSFGGSDEITIELIQDGNVVYSTVAGADGAYAISDVAAGNYTLKVSKKNHVALELAITVEADVAQDAKICLVGDITGDGKVNMKDWTQVYAHISETSTLEGYKWTCADANGDGKVNMKDWIRIYAHISEVNPLW